MSVRKLVYKTMRDEGMKYSVKTLENRGGEYNQSYYIYLPTVDIFSAADLALA